MTHHPEEQDHTPIDTHHQPHVEEHPVQSQPTQNQVVELLQYGTVKSEKKWPLSTLSGIVRTSVNIILSPVDRLSAISDSINQSIVWTKNAHGIVSKTVIGTKWFFWVWAKVLAYPFSLMRDVYNGVWDVLTHVTNGTTNWFWNTGKRLWNAIRTVYWSPTILLDKLFKSKPENLWHGHQSLENEQVHQWAH